MASLQASYLDFACFHNDKVARTGVYYAYVWKRLHHPIRAFYRYIYIHEIVFA